MKLMREKTIIMHVEVNELDGRDYTGIYHPFCFDVTDDFNILDNKNDNCYLVNVMKTWFKNSLFFTEYADLQLYEYEIYFSAVI